LQVGALGDAGAASDGRFKRLPSGGGVSRHLEEVAPHGEEAVVGGDSLVAIEGGEQAQAHAVEPAQGKVVARMFARPNRVVSTL
jgi:hypothetical protein